MSRQTLPAFVAIADQRFLARTFENRSGRIISLTRLVMASVFLLVLWLDPAQPVRGSSFGYAILIAYTMVAMAMCLIAWRSWWWDNRLAWPGHALDTVAFLATIFFTESTRDDFTSPFLAFYSYLMLSATIRWGWRVTAATALVVTLLYLLVGIMLEQFGIDLDTLRFGRRVAYMVTLSLILIWLGHARRGRNVGRFVESPGATDEALPPLLDALAYAMAQAGAARGAIAWADDEEPGIELRTMGLDPGSSRLASGNLHADNPLATNAMLFDRRKERSLQISPGGWSVAVKAPVKDALAEYCSVNEGLAIPFEAVTGRGTVLLAGISGANADHLAIAREIAREIGAGFDRHSTMILVREGAIARMRDAVARDLHDTIAQSLAGAALRVEGLRNWIAGGGDPEPEIQSIKAALKGEQSHVRGLIDRLRRGETNLPDTPASRTIAPLLSDLATYWGITVRLDRASAALPVPGWLVHELRQLLREAVANAVRHGLAKAVDVSLVEQEGLLHVMIADNGSGFGKQSEGQLPRSMNERITQLGGRLEVETSNAGATLRFTLPRQANR